MPQVILLRRGQSPQVVARIFDIWHLILGQDLLNEKVLLSSRVKPSQHEGKEGKPGCGVLKDGVRAVAGFGQAKKHKWAMHFGGAHTQFICLHALQCESHHGGASNYMTSVMSRKKSVTMSLCHRVGDPFGNREGIWKPGSELPTHSGSTSGVRLNKHIPLLAQQMHVHK